MIHCFILFYFKFYFVKYHKKISSVTIVVDYINKFRKKCLMSCTLQLEINVSLQCFLLKLSSNSS